MSEIRGAERLGNTAGSSDVKVKRSARTIALMGPAFVVGALQFGPGNAVSAASAGASLGYGVIWLIALSTFFMLVYVDMAVRIGIAYPTTLIRTVKDNLGKTAGVVTGIAIFLAAFTFMVGNLVGTGIGLSLLFGGPIQMWAAISVAVVLVLLWTGRYYGIIEKFALVVIGLMVLAFAATAIIADPDWGSVAAGFLPGSFRGDVVLALALVGTNLSMYSAFYMAYSIREKGTTVAQYRQTTAVDTVPGVLAPGIVTILVVIAAAAVAGGQEIGSPADLADILRPTLGATAFVVFAVGIFAAGFSSVTGGVANGGTAISDSLDLGNKLEHRNVRIAGTVGLLLSLAMVMLFGGLPVQAIVFSNAFALLVFPWLATLFLIMANRRSMGRLRNKWWQNVLGALGWLVVVSGAVMLVVELVSG